MPSHLLAVHRYQRPTRRSHRKIRGNETNHISAESHFMQLFCARLHGRETLGKIIFSSLLLQCPLVGFSMSFKLRCATGKSSSLAHQRQALRNGGVSCRGFFVWRAVRPHVKKFDEQRETDLSPKGQFVGSQPLPVRTHVPGTESPV